MEWWLCNLRDREKHSAFTGYRGEENLFRNRDGLPQKMLCIFSQDDLGKKKKKRCRKNIWNINFGLARIIYSATLCCWLRSASSSTGRRHERGVKALYLFNFFPQSCPFFRSTNGDEMFWVKVMSFFPVGQSETRRPGENPPFTLDFQHLEEFRCCRIASCVCLDLAPSSSVAGLS